MSSSPIQKTTNVGDLREELDTIVEDLVKKIQNLHQTDARVGITRTEILEHMKLKIVPDVYIVEPNPINIATGLGPLFLKLPREVRDMIYGPVLASGHTQILKASRALEEEGMSLISQHGICRINMSSKVTTGFAQPTQQTVDIIKNVQVRVDTWYSESYYYKDSPGYHLLEMFASAKFLPHRTCSMAFKTYPTHFVGHIVFNLLETLERFDKVALSLEVDSITGISSLDESGLYFAVREGSMRFGMPRIDMERTLGTVYLEKNDEGDHIVFYPRYACGKVKESSLEKKVM